jgi:hypothetical protein
MVSLTFLGGLPMLPKLRQKKSNSLVKNEATELGEGVGLEAKGRGERKLAEPVGARVRHVD